MAPSEKYEIYIRVLTGQPPYSEVADTWRVVRSAVFSVCRTVKQGTMDALTAVVTEQTTALHLHQEYVKRTTMQSVILGCI